MGENHQQQEQQPVLRSINNEHRSFVKFINKTLHSVVLYWIDYQGQAVSYGVLAPGDCLDIDTFVTHPWIFVDAETRDRYTVNQRDVFFPEAWFVRYRGLRQSELPQRRERTNVYITLPVYTLRELSLRAIKRRLTYDRQAFQLDIPRSLQHELATMLPRNDDSNDQDVDENEDDRGSRNS
ncbi:von Hippel-Lindau disease tumor suppressor [Megachile rotundata]|uniref:von Hippel-Lindau disease tumor suppressor n=1 Tax=Megachile rotundata TaxID=143995 RepID=UPI000258E5B3|nr:PREDICTED: von Hippel-Lindau disease tumor suppressor [Megachile rotundata]XP_012142417.1 PREDICTED: von Hippel-Lindau disease tumor suppressor [Megachile rotundata]